MPTDMNLICDDDLRLILSNMAQARASQPSLLSHRTLLVATAFLLRKRRK